MENHLSVVTVGDSKPKGLFSRARAEHVGGVSGVGRRREGEGQGHGLLFFILSFYVNSFVFEPHRTGLALSAAVRGRVARKGGGEEGG